MKTPKANAGLGVGWLQLATYPQSPFSGPVGCCDVTDLYQAFRAAHRPGAIMDKSRRRFVIRLDALWGSTRKAPTKTSITLPFQDSSQKNKNSNHCSAKDTKVGMNFSLPPVNGERSVTPPSNGEPEPPNPKLRTGNSPQRCRGRNGDRNGSEFWHKVDGERRVTPPATATNCERQTISRIERSEVVRQHF